MENKVTLLDKLWVICEHAGYSDIPYEFCKNDHIYEKEIKEALIDYEKQNQILKVLKSRPVHTSWFTFYETYEQYYEDNDNIDCYVDKKNMLTKEEFYLLKEYFDGK